MDTFSAMKQLNTVLRFVGLSYVFQDGNRLKQSQSLYITTFYIILFTFANIVCLYIKFNNNGGLTTFNFKDVVHFVYLLGYFLYISDMYFVYKHRHIYVKYINTYDNIDRILGVNYTCLIKSQIMKTSLSFVIPDLVCSLFEYIFWCYLYGWLIPIIYSIEYIYYFFISLSLADMVANIIQLEYRLRVIGDLLENDTDTICVKSIKKELILESFDSETPNRNSLAVVDSDGSETKMWITRCYLSILDQADCMNAMYGLKILATSVVLLITLIMLLNIIIRSTLGSVITESQEIRYLFIVTGILRLIARCSVAFYAVHRRQICYKQTDRIIRIIDHTLIMKNVCPSTARALRGLRELALSRPLSIHANSFFRLDYTFLV